MKKIAALSLFALGGCAAGGHPLDCMTGLVAWSDCSPGTKGYLYHQRSLAAASADDDAKCQSYGAKPGTDAYVQCRQRIDEQRHPVTR